jgi:hypothetical protein
MQTILILRLLGAQSQSLDKTTDEVPIEIAFASVCIQYMQTNKAEPLKPN